MEARLWAQSAEQSPGDWTLVVFREEEENSVYVKCSQLPMSCHVIPYATLGFYQEKSDTRSNPILYLHNYDENTSFLYRWEDDINKVSDYKLSSYSVLEHIILSLCGDKFTGKLSKSYPFQLQYSWESQI